MPAALRNLADQRRKSIRSSTNLLVFGLSPIRIIPKRLMVVHKVPFEDALQGVEVIVVDESQEVSFDDAVVGVGSTNVIGSLLQFIVRDTGADMVGKMIPSQTNEKEVNHRAITQIDTVRDSLLVSPDLIWVPFGMFTSMV